MLLTNHTVIFGGAFDPPHSGHQAIISWLVESLDAERVILCPTYEHYFGKKMVDFNHRIAMCRFLEDHYFPRVYVDEIEKDLPKPNLTRNLLSHYDKIKARSKLATVIGADNLNQIHKWNGWDEVVRLAKIVAVGRPGFETKGEQSFDVDIYNVGISTISSTEVRKKLSNKESLDGFVPHKVNQYIKEYGLYQ